MKILFIILIICFSCEKETTYCYRCETIASGEIISTVSTCGMTESDIIDFQKGLETQSSAILECETKTNCVIKTDWLEK